MITHVMQYWHQGSPPPEIARRQQSWALPGCAHQVFDQHNAAAFLRAHFPAERAEAFARCAIPAMASDFFRYHALAALGGLYVDSALEAHEMELLPDFLRNVGVFISSAPSNHDSPEEIWRAQHRFGRVMLNGTLFCAPDGRRYFALLAELVTRMVSSQAASDIPHVTGIAVLSVFDFAVRNAERLGLEAVRVEIEAAAGPDQGDFVSQAVAFIADHWAEIQSLYEPDSLSASDDAFAFHFRRSGADANRFSDPDHWSNHQGSIFTAP